MERYFIISENELVDLLVNTYKLMALESGGVDNWDWYGQALSDFIERNGEFYEIALNELNNYDELED